MTPRSSPLALPRRIGKLFTWHRWSIYIILSLCASSGLLWLIRRDLLGTNHPQDHTILVLHGITAYLALIALGSVLTTHVRVAWKAKKNRGSGALLLSVLGMLSLTGLGLYYGSEALHFSFKWGHVGLGLLLIVCFPLHLFVGKNRARAAVHTTPI
jgi:hypothetical protein